MKAHLDRARDFERRIRTGEAENSAEVASTEGVSRARVSQLLRLLKLAPEILEDIDAVDSEAPMLKEKELRGLTGIRPASEQVALYRRLLANERTPTARDTRRPEARVRRRGLQHLFVEARRYAALLESGEVSSYAEIGRQEGVSGARVSQLVLLLHLDESILAQVDVPADQLPAGVREHSLRRIAWLKDGADQRRAFAELVAGGE